MFTPLNQDERKGRQSSRRLAAPIAPAELVQQACIRLMPRVRGFTLIELMVALAIIAILVMLALPSYIDYVVRGKLVDGANALPALRARMELYYEDNRTYLGGPCATSAAAGSFTLVCTALTDTDYVIAATGSGMTQGFVFTIDNSGNESTTSLPSSWGSVPSGGYACWITRRGATC